MGGLSRSAQPRAAGPAIHGGQPSPRFRRPTCEDPARRRCRRRCRRRRHGCAASESNAGALRRLATARSPVGPRPAVARPRPTTWRVTRPAARAGAAVLSRKGEGGRVGEGGGGVQGSCAVDRERERGETQRSRPGLGAPRSQRFRAGICPCVSSHRRTVISGPGFLAPSRFYGPELSARRTSRVRALVVQRGAPSGRWLAWRYGGPEGRVGSSSSFRRESII